MQIDDEVLDLIIDDQEEYISELRKDKETDPLFLECEEAIYTCLTELRAWRNSHRDELMVAWFDTPFGPQRLQ